jgi:Cu/Ag efflux protein CusF
MMRVWQLFISVLSFGLWMLVLFNVPSAKSPPPATGKTVRSQTFPAKGAVQSVNRDDRQFVIRHEAVSNYMAARTMPFNSRTAGVRTGLPEGDEMALQLHVAETDSWVGQIIKTGTVLPPLPAVLAAPTAPADLLEQIWQPFIPFVRAT